MLQIELYGGDQMNQLTFDRNGFYLDGRPFRIISGDIHYFRIHEKDWGKRLDLALDFGLNTIQTYVPWNAHEPKPGFPTSAEANLHRLDPDKPFFVGEFWTGRRRRRPL